MTVSPMTYVYFTAGLLALAAVIRLWLIRVVLVVVALTPLGLAVAAKPAGAPLFTPAQVQSAAIEAKHDVFALTNAIKACLPPEWTRWPGQQQPSGPYAGR